MSSGTPTPCPRCGGRTVWVCVGDSAPSCVVDCHLRVDAPIIADGSSPLSRAPTSRSPGGSGTNVRILRHVGRSYCLPGQLVTVTLRPQVSLRLDRSFIIGAPADWRINQIAIGNLILPAAPMTGDALSAIPSPIAGMVVGAGMDIRIVLTYIGVTATGALFVCALFGAALP